MCGSGNWPFGQFLKGGVNRPRFCWPPEFRPPPPRSRLSTCNNMCNAELCSTVIASIHRCSTGLGCSAGVPRSPRRKVNTTCSVVIDPRVRVSEFLSKTANHFLANFPYHRSHQRNFAPECPTIALTPNMDSTPTRKLQTQCERFWSNLEGTTRSLVEELVCRV